MLEMKRTTIGAVGMLFDGPHATPTRRSDGPYFLNIASLKSGRLDLSESDHVTEEDFVRWTRRVTPRAGDLLFSYETRLGEAALMPEGVTACLGRRMALLRPDRSIVEPRFLLYFYLGPSFQRIIAVNTIHGATVPRIGLAKMPTWKIEIPELPAQNAIAEVLGALDEKIAANDRTLARLGELTVATYESHLAHGFTEVLLDRVAEFRNRQRIPLSSRERQSRTGTVPYYGAAGPLDFVDKAIFNAPLVLVGEDGSVVREDGRPVVQYIWGPTWVNNHAHVLTGRGISTELLRIAVERSNVTHLVTGAVQPKISMKNLKTLRLQLPVDNHRIDKVAQSFAALHRALSSENGALAQIRDELLPPLMSGKVRVREAEKIVEGVV